MNRPTVTTNTALPSRIGEFETLTEALDYAARGETGCNFFSSRGDFEVAATWKEIRDRAMALARAFDRVGFPRGARMAIVAETKPEFMYFFFACQYAGMLPVALPLSMHLSGHDEYVQRLAKLIAKADARYAVGSADLIAYVREAAPDLEMAGTPDDYYALPSEGGNLRPFQSDERSYIQFSSGSTSSPRGVTVSQRSITANARGILKGGLQYRATDRANSWLPLYHDMGLVGFCLTPMMAQSSIDYMSTQSFARRPLVWLRLMSEYGATIAFSPNFGYELCARRELNGSAKDLDLRQWRVAGIGGDMIYPGTLDRFAEVFGPVGFSPKAFVPSYGQAETTLATTFAPVGGGYEVEYVDRNRLAETGEIVRANINGHDPNDAFRPFVKCGLPLPGHGLEIRDDGGSTLPEGHVGRVVVRGPSIMEGYYRDETGTAAVMEPNGWMDTGDLGYLSDGQLVITGRQKDLIILNGKNIWPQDIEQAVEQLERVRGSDVACFSIPLPEGGEHMVVIVHCRVSDKDRRDHLRKSVMATVKRISGADCQILLVPPGTLPFTSSGKLSRAAAKADFISGEIADLEAPPPHQMPQAGESLTAAAR
ncbi:MAG: fatty acyl-AMP ligase [Alphaproteobacteria bacterium]|nr:fatty acyl-AMP ligase [Alphaproteobacteria bacterium]MCZ6763591.1 fatty acyl-AMP ligase [Alphaproteobacteria bacterium]